MKKNLLLVGIAIFISLFLVEIILRLTTSFPNTLIKNAIPDKYLEYKMNPKSSGIDENGFRNPKALKQADIVTLGDSHTYGYNVESQDSWPRVLGRKTGMSVYNFGVGGYGVLQYYHLFNEALKMNPKHIIVGLFIPNDLRDTCITLKKIAYWQKWARDKGLNIASCINAGGEKSVEDDQILNLLSTANKSALISALDYLLDYRLIRKNQSARRKFLLFPNSPEWKTFIIDDDKNKTKLSSLYLTWGAMDIDLEQPHINSSFKMTKYIFKEMKKRCDEKKISFSVILIPSKHAIFYNYLQKRKTELPDYFHQTIKTENSLKSKFKEFFIDQKIAHFDSQPYMEKAVVETGNVYRNSGDYHPLAPGYEAYAEAAYDGLFRN